MEQEKRAIVVSSSRAQKKYVIQSEATTLGEFKEECRQAGIDYTGLIFKEAISNTEMLDDNSLLPREVLYKGVRTNNLVFSLTMPRKDIGSGATDRKEILAKIKFLGLQDACKEKYGNNFTRVSTANLEELINDYMKKDTPCCSEDTEEKECNTSNSEYAPKKQEVSPIMEKCNELRFIAERLGIIADSIVEMANKHDAIELTDSDINNILRDL